MNNKILKGTGIILIAAFVLFIGVLIYNHWYQSQVEIKIVEPVIPVKVLSTSTPNMVNDKTANWQVYKNEQLGFEMKYPQELFLSDSLKPVVTTINCDYNNFEKKCPFVPIAGFTGTEAEATKDGLVKSEKIKVNDKSFCLQKESEGAAGTTYITYSYTSVYQNKCLLLSFSVPYPNCENYLPTETPDMQVAYEKCKRDNETVKPETIQEMLSSVKF